MLFIVEKLKKDASWQPQVKNLTTETNTTSSQLLKSNELKKIETAMILLNKLKKDIDLSQKNILKKSQKTDVYESEIKKIEFTEGLKNTVKYDVFIALSYKQGENLDIHLNKNDLSKTKVFTKEGEKLLPYSLSSIKEGDRVKIELITNILEYYDKNTEQITITKYSK